MPVHESAPDLLSFAWELASTWPSPEEEDELPPVLLSRETLPTPPARLRTNRLLVALGRHGYSGEMPQPEVAIYGDTLALRALGLLIFAQLFHPDAPQVQVDLAVPSDGVLELLEMNPGGPGVLCLRHLVILSPHDSPESRNCLFQVPTSFLYTPQYLDQRPLSGFDSSQRQWRDLPHVYVTGLKDLIYAHDHERDTLVGFGSAIGSSRFAECLLNAAHVRGHEASEVTGFEFRFESEVGFTGVAPGSAEIRLVLPGGISWLWPQLPDLSSVCTLPGARAQSVARPDTARRGAREPRRGTSR